MFLLIKNIPSDIKFRETCSAVLNLSWSKKSQAPLNTGKMYPDRTTGLSQMVCKTWRLIWWNKIKWGKLYTVINPTHHYLKCFVEVVFTVSNGKDQNI